MSLFDFWVGFLYNEGMKKVGFKKSYQKYVKGDFIRLTKWQWVGVMMLVWVISGFIGWVYELLVGLISQGEFYMVGGNLLPWMNIYAIGAVLLVPIVWRIRKYPWVVFLVSALVTGVVELVGGWLVYTVGNGTRYWNYDQGPWAFGSINGFVCPLSVTIFGAFALVLCYAVLPWLVFMAGKWTQRAFLTLAVTLFVVVMVDELTNLTLKNLGEPTAMDFYRSLGLKYQEF